MDGIFLQLTHHTPLNSINKTCLLNASSGSFLNSNKALVYKVTRWWYHIASSSSRSPWSRPTTWNFSGRRRNRFRQATSCILWAFGSILGLCRRYVPRQRCQSRYTTGRASRSIGTVPSQYTKHAENRKFCYVQMYCVGRSTCIWIQCRQRWELRASMTTLFNIPKRVEKQHSQTFDSVLLSSLILYI